ncbi:MAG: hypothetical protein PHE21_03210 [Candidatus Dojkabacteria bacterium]|nr:hypothetical protein [Candidatus Dojkabacteria bacterium]
MKLKLKINIKSLVNYIFVILISSGFIASILIALPLTETFLNKTPYDLYTKDYLYWSKEYTLEIDSENPKEIENVRNIIFKRLDRFEVEDISITKLDKGLKVKITTSKNKEVVEELIKNRFYSQIVTRKEDVDFENEEDQYAYLLATNYNATNWDRSDFRNVYLTQLKASTGEYSYFAIFKLWPNKLKEFNKFLSEYKGQYIGVSIDGLVTPYFVSEQETENIFAIPISTDDETQIKAISILYNSGTINSTFTVSSETDIPVVNPKINYIAISILIFLGLVLTYGYLLISKNAPRDILIKSLLTTVLTMSIYLSILKLSQLPVDLFILPIEAILTMILIRVISENKDSTIYIESILLVVLGLTTFLGTGFIAIIARDLLVLLAFAKILLVISGWYIKKLINI